jgi:hypothetical protein
MIVTAALAVALGVVQRRVEVSRAVEACYAIAVVFAVVAGLSAAVVAYGGPAEIARKARSSFEGPVKGDQNGGLNSRLFTLASNGRVDQWRAAWRDYTAHPWLGAGAGSFETYWLQHRPLAFKVRDAHSLYLETLAELGPLGLVLLLVGLACPLVAGARARHGPVVPAAFGAYVAFLAHAAVDWDWELAAVTLAALLVAASLLIATRDDLRAFTFGRVARGILVAGLGVIVLFSVIGIVGNRAVASSSKAVDSARWLRAEKEARKAIRWAPWSAEAWQNLADAQLGLGRQRNSVKSLRVAARMAPNDWSVWYDLAVASTGGTRKQAFLRAQALNPLSPNVAVLSERGYGK